MKSNFVTGSVERNKKIKSNNLLQQEKSPITIQSLDIQIWLKLMENNIISTSLLLQQVSQQWVLLYLAAKRNNDEKGT